MTASPPVRKKFNFWTLFPAFWLMFLAYPILGFFDHARPPSGWLLFWGVLAGFLAVYWRVFFVKSAGPGWVLAGWAYTLIAYFVLLPVVGGGATAFLVYGGSIIGYQRRVSLALGLAMFNAMVMSLPLWSGQYTLEDLAWLGPNMIFTLVAAYANHSSYRREVLDRQLVQVQAEKEKLAADAERERIARDLHDILGHTLSVIVLKSELASRLAERDPARAAQEIREVERISRGALQEVRSAVRGYQGSGLNAELARAKVALDAAGVRMNVSASLPELPPQTEASAAMLLREAVTNIVRHARAKEVWISLAPAGNGHCLTVRDDGVGGLNAEGSGLTGMRERLRAIGGTLERRGEGGTTLTAQIPAAQELSVGGLVRA